MGSQPFRTTGRSTRRSRIAWAGCRIAKPLGSESNTNSTPTLSSMLQHVSDLESRMMDELRSRMGGGRAMRA